MSMCVTLIDFHLKPTWKDAGKTLHTNTFISCAGPALQYDLMWKEVQMLWGGADSLHRMPQLSSAGLGLKDKRQKIKI